MEFANQIQTGFTRGKIDSDAKSRKDLYSPPLNIFLKKTDKNSDNKQVLKEIGLMLLIFAVYSVSGKLGLNLAFENRSATPVWAPTGIALAAFLMRGYHVWPAILLGAFVVNLTTTLDISTSICIAFGNTAEGLVGAYLVNRYANGKYAFESPQTYIKFIFLAGIFSTALSATIGVTSLTIEGFANWNSYLNVWLTWWIGDAMGAFLVAPLLIMWFLERRLNWDKGKLIEAFSLFMAVTLICVLEFNPFFTANSSSYQFKYILLPAFVWIAYRFSPRDTATAVFVFCAFAIWATLRGLGPFVVQESPNVSLLYLQAFMIVLTVMSVGFAFVTTERNKIQQSLKEARDRLEERVEERTAELNILVEELQRENSERKLIEDEIKQKNALVKLLQEIAIEANQAVRTDEVLKFALDKICGLMSWPIGHVYMVEKPDKLISTKIWNSGFSEEYNAFKQITEATNLKNGIGLPGRILQSGKPVWVPDVNKDDNFPRAKAAKEIKVKAAFGFPIITENEIVGVLEFFAPEAHEPDKNVLEITYNIGTQIGRVAERQRAIEIIKANEGRFRAVSETANDAIISADDTGKIYYFNKSAQTIFGYRPHEVLGKPLTMLMPEQYHERHKHGFSRFLMTGKSDLLGRTVELSGKRKNGEEFPIELSLAKWETDGEIHFTGMIRDITDRKKAEQQLKKNEKQLQDAQHLAHLGSFEWDVARNKVTWSDELYHIYGLKPGDFDGTYESFLQRLHPDDTERVAATITECYPQGKPFVLEERIVRPDGNVRVLHTYAEFIKDEKGNITRLIGACQDVTEQKEAGEELRRTYEKLKETQNELIHSEKLASLGRFSSGIAHEIRNPLANISALAQIVSRHKVDKNMKQHLRYILANVDIANKIIKDLLDFASPHEIEFEQAYIGKIIDNLYDIVKTRCAQNNIRLTKKIKPNLPPTMLNEKSMQTAFLNFVSNAIDAMPKGGSLTITADKDDSSNEIVITFEDTGMGISQDDIDKVFEPFYTTKDEGTGLGLSLAYQVIKTHSGKLDISSKVKQGTKISIRLPIRTVF